MSGPMHQPRRAWTPGGYALRTLQHLAAAGAAAVPDTELLAACNAERIGSGRKRRMAHYRRDIIANLHERGYIAPGAAPRTWRLLDAARAELERMAAGLAARASLLADNADDEPEPMAAQLPRAGPTLADLVRPDLRDAITRGIVRPPMSAADRAPCTERAGSTDALACPSRRGSRLYWRDGRITQLDGRTPAA